MDGSYELHCDQTTEISTIEKVLRARFGTPENENIIMAFTDSEGVIEITGAKYVGDFADKNIILKVIVITSLLNQRKVLYFFFLLYVQIISFSFILRSLLILSTL